MSTTPFPFLSLPLELRESIYSLYFKPSDRLVRNISLDAQGFFGGVYKFEFDIYRVNKQVYREAERVWKRENVFVKIATPWPSAGMYRVYLMATDGRDLVDMDADGGGIVNHVSSEGLVPIVCTDRRADTFNTHHALVQIAAPFHQAVPEHTVVVLLDDLHLFARTWYYSALSYPMLNDRLSTTFVLRNPGTTEGAGDVSLALQRRLLFPFAQVKGLYHMDMAGYAPEIQAELRRRMLVPIPTLAESCEKAVDLMEAGDQALASNNPTEGLNLYRDAFHAIHILIHARTRRILADVFFHETIETGRFAGQGGMTVRVDLRLKLVSRYVLAYLKLGDYGEAAYWGMRSIRIMRESIDAEYEDYIAEFIGGEDVGMIYVRTGVAFWGMQTDMKRWESELNTYEGDELAGSERIWVVAKKYLTKQDKGPVRKELTDFGVSKDVVAMFGDTDVKSEGFGPTGQEGSEQGWASNLW